VEHLSSAQRERIEGMVNFDSLGLGPTEVWASHADKLLLDALDVIAQASKLPVTVMNPENGATADSESFARYHIPRITLHSVTGQTWSILHSPLDKMAAVRMSDYYDSYKLIAEYVAYLDVTLKPAPTPRGAARD
jgi:Iap family predicted aminopeptidase